MTVGIGACMSFGGYGDGRGRISGRSVGDVVGGVNGGHG